MGGTATPTLDELRLQFLQEVAEAAPVSGDTKYSEWHANIQRYLGGLKPWLTSDDMQELQYKEFNVPPNTELVFSVDGYSFFRAWLRRNDIDPEEYAPDEIESNG